MVVKLSRELTKLMVSILEEFGKHSINHCFIQKDNEDDFVILIKLDRKFDEEIPKRLVLTFKNGILKWTEGLSTSTENRM